MTFFKVSRIHSKRFFQQGSPKGTFSKLVMFQIRSVAQSCPTLCNPQNSTKGFAEGNVAHQAPLFMGFSRQEYWSGLLFPSPGIFLTQGPNPSLLGLLHWQTDSLPLSYLGTPI